MRIAGLLVIAGILSANFAIATAQAPTHATPAPSAGFSPVPHDSRIETPKLGGIGKPAAQSTTLAQLPELRTNQIVVLRPKHESVCYAMRTYNLEAQDSVHGVTNLKSTTTCELASNVRLKDASGPLMK